MSSHCNPALSFFTHLLLLGGQFAPLVAQHPGDLWEGHVRTLGPELLPPVIHETNVASERGFGCIAVFHWLLPLPPFGPAATTGFLREKKNKNKKRAKQKHFEGSVGKHRMIFVSRTLERCLALTSSPFLWLLFSAVAPGEPVCSSMTSTT